MSKLIIVPTPIGNFGDMSRRAIEAIGSCDIVLCEDTRVCSRLLRHFKLDKKMIVCRDDNERSRIPKIIDAIRGGKVVCLTCDAGTPAISDPGFGIVRACRKCGIAVEVIPGPCAIPTALCASGLPSDGFLFLGFLPSRTSARVKTFQRYADFDHSMIFYESCHRILKFLGDLRAVMGENRVVCIARELTKLHETFHVGEVGHVCGAVAAEGAKGEYVAIVAPKRFKL
ncbi:MAG: 16S rRNA (cytidine(1402)-2'-O)-methyltransferase [Puniceicoccales bacterium]|nr:16S rRNA (cytidine(1402)-2'-O)-methyltransferase [Puniceicoccales bacterium]